MSSLKPEPDAWTDPSVSAQDVLSYVLKKEDPSAIEVEQNQIAVEEAKRAGYVIDQDTGRVKSRVLFITTDRSVVDKQSAVRNHYIGLAALFDEVHIILIKPQVVDNTVERIDKNLWLYTAGALTWWDRIFEAHRVAKANLIFNTVIRPDIIVATDPFVSAAAAGFISWHFKRQFQVHITEPSFNGFFPGITGWFAKLILRRAAAVRVKTEPAYRAVKRIMSSQADVTTLPTFHNFSQFRDSEATFRLKERYPDYSFFILSEAPLSADSHLHDVISALRSVLLNPKIALINLGEGPAEALFAEKVKLLGIENNVLFLKRQTDLISYYRTADVLIEAGESGVSDEHILQAVMAALPVVTYATDLRRSLLKDGESAFICEPGEVYCLTQKVNNFLNKSALRTQFRHNITEVARTRLKESPEGYYLALRDSIESTLLKGLEISTPKSPAETKAVDETVPKKDTVQIAVSA